MNALQFASDLIRFDSVSTQSNNDVGHYVDSELGRMGFDTERIEYERDGVQKVNVIGKKGAGTGGIAYFGHTDVVPVDAWEITDHGPFTPSVREGRLYGRGSTDMKGSIACMMAAVDAMSSQSLAHPIYLCCSADEELDHRGIKEVIERSAIYREIVSGKACGIVGEPTGLEVVYAHKGGVQIVATSNGKAAHSSTREGLNANLAMIPFLQVAKNIYEETERDTQWMDPEFDPPSVCLNIGINDHTAAVNITAPQSICTLCFRPMPKTNSEQLIQRLRDAAKEFGIEFELASQNPPFTRDPNGPFARACAETCGAQKPRTVGYGSEAGNLTEIEQLVVLGPGDIDQAHKSDEWISLKQLDSATSIYQQIIQRWCCRSL